VIEYCINVSNVTTYEEFVAAFNTGMIDSLGGHWHGDLNAFNDYLSWPSEPYRITFQGWALCKERLASARICNMPIIQTIQDIFTENPEVAIRFE